MFRGFLLLFITLIIVSCVRSDREPTYAKPKSEKFFGLVPDDIFVPKQYTDHPFQNIPSDPNDSYSQGYQAGCQTMSSAVGEGLIRVRGPKIDTDKLTTDAWYLRGYNDGGTACTFALDWELH